MREEGCSFEKGARIFINSSVPVGKGVISSASLEVSTGCEIGVGNFLSDTAPEERAAELRATSTVHYKINQRLNGV